MAAGDGFHLPALIDYRRLAEAVSFYEGRGFSYLEVPWVASAASVAVTLPPKKQAFSLGDAGVLVGSAEQSFIELIRQGITVEKRCAITPCFRDDAEDDLHQKYFIKLELCDYCPQGEDSQILRQKLDEMIVLARDWHARAFQVSFEETAEGTDIVCARTGIELGSYGLRPLDRGVLIYGTGHAEPRFGQVLSRQGTG